MENTLHVSKHNQGIAAGFGRVQENHWSGVYRGTELRKVLVEKELLETREASNLLEQFISFDRKRTVPLHLLLRGLFCTMRRTLSVGQCGQECFATGTGLLQCGREFPKSTSMIRISRRQFFKGAAKLKQIPPQMIERRCSSHSTAISGNPASRAAAATSRTTSTPRVSSE